MEKVYREVLVGKQLSELNENLIDFIGQQKLFFVATAGIDGRVNVSPKGMDSLRVLTPKKVAWLNLTGSGNETAAHVFEQNRITLMFCAFARQTHDPAALWQNQYPASAR